MIFCLHQGYSTYLSTNIGLGVADVDKHASLLESGIDCQVGKFYSTGPVDGLIGLSLMFRCYDAVWEPAL